MASVEATSSAISSGWTSFKMSTTNASSHLAPSPKDLLLVVPRMAAKAGSFVTEGIPEAFENIFGGGITGRTIAEATSERAGNMAAAAASATTGSGATVAGAAAPIQSGAVGNGSIFSLLTFQQIKTFGGIFSYMTSKWALGCFAAAVILNRTSIYAASRRHFTLDWQLRAALRLIPIILLFNETVSLLRAIRCQTSPHFSFMRYGSPDNYIALDFAGEGGFLQSFSSWQLFWESEEASCLNVGMIPTKDNPTQAFGSLSLIWPAFLTFCFSQFIETLSCAVEGRNTATETGMSLFEHSLAYAEAESMVFTQISLPSLGSTSSSIAKLVDSKREAGDPSAFPIKGMVLKRFNTAPEVLLMSLLSSLNHMTSHILGIFGLQSKYRLINTGLWGLCFMFSFWWGFLSSSLESGFDAPLFRFPTVCIVGFIPHILIVAGISLCGCIYGVALVLSVLSPSPNGRRARTWRERFQHAHQNMQANSQLSGLRLHWHEDFYTALLRAGFAALMAASEAVFLNEGRSINVGQWTWLEEDRMNEILRNRSAPTDAKGALEQAFDITQDISIMTGDDDDDGKLFGQSKWRSGYTRERSTKALKGKAVGSGVRNQDMVGAFQRSGRYVLALDFLLKIFWLMIGWSILSAEKVVQKFGIEWRPGWVQSLLATSKKGSKPELAASTTAPKELDFWMLTDGGELTLPRDNNIDVEQEVKRRLRMTNPTWNEERKAELDSRLYSWFKYGGWWGERDSSGDYIPTVPDDEDTTSVISFSETETETESGWESESSGRRTPTLSDPNPSATNRAINDISLDPFHLASLLNPRTPEQRDEARMLSARLTTPKPLTRSQFSRLSDSENAHLLTSTKYRPADFRPSDPSGKLTAMEEAEILEYLIIRFRSNKRPSGADAGSQNWSEGAEGLGAGGPMCVVCQSSPRTILAWPCRCLSLCEECRVSLAMNNFGTCVCCRQEVVGFSRLFVP